MALRMKHHLGTAVASLRYEPTVTRTRAYVGDRLVVDSRSAVLVWEPRRLVPVFAVPVVDVAAEVAATDPPPAQRDLTTVPPMLGPDDFGLHTTPGRVVDLVVDGQPLAEAGFLPADEDLTDMVVLDFDAFDRWRLEDQELVGHAHDPFKRIEVLPTSQHVEVFHNGVLLASSHRPLMLLETHLPARFYLPPQDVELDLFVPSATRSTCAYKGHASYLTLERPRVEDIAWLYADPLRDAEQVLGHVCFWAERTDYVVDGVALTRPVTPWSSPDEQAQADPDKLEFG